MGKRLGVLVDTRMTELDVSLREVTTRSGGLLSHATVANARNGENKKFEPRTLHALAMALGLPAEKVLEAYEADLADTKPVRMILPAKADTLSAAGRRALISHLEWLLEQERRRARG